MRDSQYSASSQSTSRSFDALLEELYKDGGAFPSLFFQQYPQGMGVQRHTDHSVRNVQLNSSSRNAPPPSSKGYIPTFVNRATMRSEDGTVATRSPAQSPCGSTASSTFPQVKDSVKGAGPIRNALVVVPTPKSSGHSPSSLSSSSALPTREEQEKETMRQTYSALQEVLEKAAEEEKRKRELLVTTGSVGKAIKEGKSASLSSSSSLSPLTLVVPENSSSTEVELGGPIVRSPTKQKKSAVWEKALGLSSPKQHKEGEGADPNLGNVGEEDLQKTRVEEAVEAIPFCVSGWLNKKKLIVPIEQRIAQEVDERLNHQTAIGSHIIDLAVAMQAGKKAVQEEIEEQQRAQRAAAERQQALLEAEEAEKGRKLLEEKALRLSQQQQRKETRAERLERIRVERELREREQQEYQRKRLRERAAARLQMTVEALEADEDLLQKVEQHHHVQHSSGTSSGVGVGSLTVGGGLNTSEKSGTILLGETWGGGSGKKTASSRREGMETVAVGRGEDQEDMDEDGSSPSRRVVHMKPSVFTGANVSNEGVKREMEALEKQEQLEKARLLNGNATGEERQGSDGIHWKDPTLRHLGSKLLQEDEDEEEDDDDEELGKLQKKRRLRL